MKGHLDNWMNLQWNPTTNGCFSGIIFSWCQHIQSFLGVSSGAPPAGGFTSHGADIDFPRGQLNREVITEDSSSSAHVCKDTLACEAVLQAAEGCHYLCRSWLSLFWKKKGTEKEKKAQTWSSSSVFMEKYSRLHPQVSVTRSQHRICSAPSGDVKIYLN